MRGTIAMAKGSNPDSATSEWFINLDDNSTALDNPLNAGGFTVFGVVTESGMNVVDDLVAIPTFSFAANPVYGFPGFATLPLFNFPSGLPVQTSNLVLLNKVSITELDDDSDGVVNSIEDAAPNGGDGNGDGVPDRLQANVASLFDALDYPVTLVAPASTRLVSVTSLGEEFLVTNISSVGKLFDGINLGHGFFKFTIRDVAPGGAVDLDLIIHSGPSPDTYFKFGPTAADPLPHWYKFKYDGQTGAEVNGSVVTLHFQDGGRGDSDLVANGEITDPGAPATNIGNSGSGNGGGGCALLPASIYRNYDGSWLLLAMFIFCIRVYRRLSPVDR